MFYTKLEGPALQAYNQMVDRLYQRAMEELKVSKESLVMRQLRPEDLGLSTPEWTFNIASSAAWNTMIDAASISNNRFVGIHGISYPVSATQAVSQLKITVKGNTARYWQVQGINNFQDPAFYFDDPFTVDQNTTITVTGYGVSTGSTEKIMLLGQVVEKDGILVKKTN